MAEFKKVFNLVSERIITAGLDSEDFLSWLGKIKPQGDNLESWTADEIQPLVEKYRASKGLESTQAILPKKSSFLEDDNDLQGIEMPPEGFTGSTELPAELEKDLAGLVGGYHR